MSDKISASYMLLTGRQIRNHVFSYNESNLYLTTCKHDAI